MPNCTESNRWGLEIELEFKSWPTCPVFHTINYMITVGLKVGNVLNRTEVKPSDIL